MAPSFVSSSRGMLRGRDSSLPEGEGQSLAKGPAFLAQFHLRKPTVQKVGKRSGGQSGKVNIPKGLRATGFPDMGRLPFSHYVACYWLPAILFTGRTGQRRLFRGNKGRTRLTLDLEDVVGSQN